MAYLLLFDARNGCMPDHVPKHPSFAKFNVMNPAMAYEPSLLRRADLNLCEPYQLPLLLL